MQTQGVDGTRERRVLIDCVTFTPLLARAVARLPPGPPGPFQSGAANLVWEWAAGYYRKYAAAPGRQIESLFAAWAKAGKDKEQAAAVGRLLSSLSEEYGRADPGAQDFALDQAEAHFNEVLLRRLQEGLRDALDGGRQEQAAAAARAYQPVLLRAAPAVNVLEDEAAQRESLEAKQKVLVKYPGMAGVFFGDELGEDSFVGVMAQVKGGKSWCLLDVAWRAMLQGRNVAYFQVGDLSRNQVLRRFHKRAAYRPLEARTVRLPEAIAPPASRTDLATVSYRERVYESPITWETARRAFRRYAEKSKGRIRLSYHPIRSVSVADVKGILEGWDREGFDARVVVIDYAWNLAPVDPRAGPVDQVSMTWAMLRQLSETRGGLVVTANQSNKEGFSSWVLTRKHFADSKMVLAHVTAFLGVNMTDEEKSRGIVRYNWIARREEAFSETQCLYCASCLDVGNPVVASALPV